MSRIRVLRIIARMNVGGPALQVTGLTRGLSAQRFETRLLIGNVEPGEADYVKLRAADLEPTRIEGLGRSIKILDDARAWRRIRQEIVDFRPDIVHTHTAKAGLLGRTAARTAGVPHLVHTFHGHLLHGYFPPAVTAGVKLMERSLARRTSTLVAVGEQVRDDLLSAGIGRPDQYVVVPPGVSLPPAPSQAAARQTLSLSAEVPVIAFVARLTAVKRPDRFLRAAMVVASRHPNAIFMIAGEGELLPELRRLAEPLGTAVRFLGWRSDVEVLYAACDLVVLASDNEGMPVSLIEAALVGRPTVTTDVGSAAEVVAHAETGLVTSTGVQDLAAAIVSLLDCPEKMRAMGNAAASRATQRFSAQRLIDDTERLYEGLMGTAPPPRGKAGSDEQLPT